MKASLFILGPLITVRVGHGGSGAELRRICAVRVSFTALNPVASLPTFSLLCFQLRLLLWLLGSKL